MELLGLILGGYLDLKLLLSEKESLTVLPPPSAEDVTLAAPSIEYLILPWSAEYLPLLPTATEMGAEGETERPL